jgi:selenocysteine lyase/cysteine desulfurase
MAGSARPVYLDFAATSAIRPPSVIAAMTDYLENIGATPGRGGHRLAIAAERVALECRQALARLLGLPGDTARIAWTMNATHGLNTVLNGTLGPGDVLVVTAFDHNAVLRCAYRLERERGVRVRLVPGYADGTLDERGLDRALDGARLLSVNGASNVLGTVLDAAALCARAHAAGALAVVDAAQVAGELPFDAVACGADMVAITGHKALLGPQGIGAVWVRDGVDVGPLLVGGTGGNSLLAGMPDAWPDHLQAGTVNAPGIAGLSAGIRWVSERTVERIGREAAALKVRLWRGMSAVPGVRVLSPEAPAGAPIVTITADGEDPGTLAGRLDREYGIMARPGLHCAPETHRLLGTEATGALRFSPGWASTAEDVDRAIEAVSRLLARPVFPGAGPGVGEAR